MRLTTLGLLVPLFAAACGQSLQPLNPFDAGFTPDDLTTGVGTDMAGAGTIDLAGADFAGTVPDTTGPVITYVKPIAGSFVGGLMDLTVTITDPSGVQPGSVQAVINNDPTKYTLALGPAGTDTYHVFFDLNTLGKGIVFLALSVRADDRLGNHSELGEEVVLDNTTPWMTMNAAVPMRVSKLDATNAASPKLECSHLFSPLGDPSDTANGPEVASEGAVMKQIMGLRARIEDHGNFAPGQRVEYISDIDESTVTLFAVGNTSSPLPVLAVDTNGDGICDDVNPALVPTSGTVVMPNQALAVAMSPLADTGAANFTPSSGTVTAGVCDEFGLGTEVAPPPLCTKAGTTVTFVIPWLGKDKPIYSIPPIRDPDACVGFPLDAANHLPEGPACVLVRAADHAGNHMVSYPLHICVDLGTGVCNGFTVTSLQACTGALDASGNVMAGSHCDPAPSPTVATPEPNPGSFPTDGSEVRYLPAFQ